MPVHSFLELLIMGLSDRFMRLPWVKDCMALAYTEGRDAERYNLGTENPYSREG